MASTIASRDMTHVQTKDVARVHWGAVVAGAFSAVAAGIILGLFGAAFGLGGLGVLSGVWEVVTPLVATAIGAVVTVSMTGRRGAYLNGIMVWCVALVAGVLVLGGFGAFGALGTAALGAAKEAGARSIAAEGAAARVALTALAAILGLVGAGVGSAIGVLTMGRRTGVSMATTLGAPGEEPRSPTERQPAYREPASEHEHEQEEEELRH